MKRTLVVLCTGIDLLMLLPLPFVTAMAIKEFAAQFCFKGIRSKKSQHCSTLGAFEISRTNQISSYSLLPFVSSCIFLLSWLDSTLVSSTPFPRPRTLDEKGNYLAAQLITASHNKQKSM